MQWWSLKRLKSSNAKTRLTAVQQLGSEGETALVQPLAALLADVDAGVRAATAEALGRLKTENAIEPLARRLAVDPEIDVRRATIKALQQIGTEAVVGPLVESLGDPSGEVSWQSAQALKALAWEPADDAERAALCLATNQFDAAISYGVAAIEPLIRVAQGTSFHRSIRAVEALAMVGGAQAVKPILDCLESADFTVRSAAATALGEVGDARAIDPLIRALRDTHHQVCLAACVSLRKVGDQRAVEPVKEVLHHDAPDVRTAAIETLGKLRDASAVEALVQCLYDKDNDVREAACAALGMIGDERAIEHLVATHTDPQTVVRQAAGAALGRIQPHWERTDEAMRAIPKLQIALKSKEYWVRHTASDVLKKLGLGRQGDDVTQLATDSDGARKKRFAAQAILFSMLEDRDRAFRQAAAETIGRIGIPDGISRLVQRLADPDRGVKRAAARSLEILRWQADHLPNKALQLVALERWLDAAALGDHAIEALVEAFRWNDVSARKRTSEALVQMGTPKAVAALRSLAHSPDPAIREEAMVALAAMSPAHYEVAGT